MTPFLTGCDSRELVPFITTRKLAPVSHPGSRVELALVAAGWVSRPHENMGEH